MINPEGPYFRQVQLLCLILPLLEEAPDFALKGGTAINLFIRNMPRISVDLDLTFVPVLPRPESLKAITVMLRALGKRVRGLFKDCFIIARPFDAHGNISKITIQRGGVLVKVEVSPVLRGTLFPCETRDIAPRAMDLFGFAAARICSFPDVYGGKMCACLDRQHPRDLFDIKNLIDNEGLTDELRRAFAVYLVCHGRPISELLDPVVLDTERLFEEDFAGMTDSGVTYLELSRSRETLISVVRKAFTRQERQFIISVAAGSPKWDLAPFPKLEAFPALQWKILNVRKMSESKKQKEIEAVKNILRI